MKKIFLLLALVIFAAFVLSGCCTAYYENEIVTPAHKSYCQSPFNVYYYAGDNTDGHYIGLESYEGADYEAFVFKNLIETDEDNYIKILLPYEETQSEENEYPEGVLIIGCTEEDFAEEKMIAPATIYVPHRDSKHLRLQAVHNKEQHEYKFAFNFPAKDVLSFYKKKRPFPAYLFYYPSYIVTISLDIITLPLQILGLLIAAPYMG